MKRTLYGLAVFCAGVLAVAGSLAPAAAASDTIPFGAFGYRDTIYEHGPNAELSVFLPVTPGLRSVRLHAPLTISPLVDPRSSIVVMANDIPVRTISVRDAGRTPTLDVAIPVPPSGERSLTVSIVGHLFVLGDICADPRTNDVWFTVNRNSTLNIDSSDAGTRDQVGDFLNQYGGEFAVVAQNTNDDVRSASMELAYRLHQIERWRRISVVSGRTGAGDARTVVVGSFPNDIAVRGNELDVTPHGVALIDDRIDRILLASRISDSAFDPSPAAPKKLALDDLNVGTRTLRGTGELPFDIPVTYGAFGGVPEHLRLHVDLAHTPLASGDRAYVQVMVNNTLIGSYNMSRDGTAERFDVPLDVDAVSSSNVVRVVPTFFYERDGCRGNYPSFTATLGSDTNFQWDGIANRQLSVGEFVRAVSGKVVVLVDDPSRNAGAFALVNAIGTVNTSIRSIDVQTFNGSIPSGYDYAIVVAAGDKVDALKPPLQINGQDFTIFAADGKTARYKADYSEPFGVLETAMPGGVPTLVATYWKDAGALGGIARLDPDDVAAQTDNVLLFNARQATYVDTTPRPRPRGDGFALSIPAILGIFAVLLVGVVLVASRRKA